MPAIVIALSVAAAQCRSTVPAPEPKPALQSVPEGQAGIAGSLVVTEQAVKLAEITTGIVETTSVSEPLLVSGSIQAAGDQQAKVTPVSAGKIIKLFAGEGDTVRAGQTLALVQSPALGDAQASHAKAAARVAARNTTLARQRELAALGQFSSPQLEEARTRLAESERDMREAERTAAEERSAVAIAEADLPAHQSRLRQAESEYEVSNRESERAKSLYASGIISRKDLERAEADLRAAEADVDVAKANIEQGKSRLAGAKERLAASDGGAASARRQVQVSEEAVKREEKVYKGRYLTSREVVNAESDLREAEIELAGATSAVRLLGGVPGKGSSIALAAPISGKIQARTATLGETIDPEHAAFTIVNLDQVWAQLSVSPRDLGSVKVGDIVSLTSDAAKGKTFRGRVASISPSADETTRAVAVRTTLENPSDSLRAGAFVQGEIITDVRQARVMVPEGALQDHQGKPTVYVWRGPSSGDFEVHHVLLGIRKGGMVEVVDGLTPGLKIATGGTFYLKSEALKSSLSDGCCAPGA